MPTRFAVRPILRLALLAAGHVCWPKRQSAKAPARDWRVVPIGSAIIDGVAWHQSFAIGHEQQAAKQHGFFNSIVGRSPTLHRIRGNQRVHGIPLCMGNDGLMLTGITPDVAPSSNLPDQKVISGEDPARPPVEARFRERLATQIDTFLEEMSAVGFAGRCSATQMVQAVSFPLAVALRGRRRGWVTDEFAEKWALKIFSILFRGTGPGAGGLLRSVQQRYVQNGQADTFEDVVGDGTLWLVLVATLGGTSWHGVGTEIDKAVALREIFSSPQLLASANSVRVTGLLGKIQIEDAREYVAHVAPTVNRLLGEIECDLKPLWEVEMRGQGQRAVTHKPGDLLWRDSAKAGWAVCLEEVQDRTGQSIKVRPKGAQTAVQSGYYVNVSDVCSRNSELNRLVEELRVAVGR